MIGYIPLLSYTPDSKHSTKFICDYEYEVCLRQYFSEFTRIVLQNTFEAWALLVEVKSVSERYFNRSETLLDM
jgi:hypothetical protein